MSYIDFRDVNKSFGDKLVLSGVSFNVAKSETVCILGPSGVGKSTIFNIISGLEQADSGYINISDEISGKISYVQQRDFLLPFLNVIQNICMPLYLIGNDKADTYSRAIHLLEKFNMMEDRLKYPSQLSGGMKQKVAFLRAYMISKDIILLDEPFNAIDNIARYSLYIWIKEALIRERTTVLLITHDIDEAILLSDRILIFSAKEQSIRDEIVINNNFGGIMEFYSSNIFLEYKRDILEALTFGS